MSMVDKQNKFSRMVALLILHAQELNVRPRLKNEPLRHQKPSALADSKALFLVIQETRKIEIRLKKNPGIYEFDE